MPRPPDWPPQADLPSSGDPGEVLSADQQATAPPDPDRAQLEDRQQAARQGRWSRAELSHSLDGLPPGHPSSTKSDAPSRADDPADPDTPPASEGQQEGGHTSADQDPGTQDASRSPGGPDGGPEQPRRTFWTELPAFKRAWADHEARWPGEQKTAAVDRSRDPEGSWRGDGGQYLTPDQHNQAKDVIANVQRTEEAITGQMKEAETENAHGGHLEGLKFVRKGEDRLKEKIAEKLEHEPGRTPSDAIRQINDAVRYTFCFEPASYSDGYKDIQQRLEARGYTMIYSKNYWTNPEYKGINTRWVTPEGQRFEVQFHTPESFCAKHEVTHLAYERLRNPLTSDDERRELEAFQREVSSWVIVPRGATSIPDRLRKGS